MRAKDLFGTTVLDSNINEVGKIDDVDFVVDTGAISKVIISTKKGIFSNDSIEINFNEISKIGDYALLKSEIVIDDDEEVSEVTVEVEDE